MKFQTEGKGVNQEIYNYLFSLFDGMEKLPLIESLINQKKMFELMRLKDINFVEYFLETFRVKIEII